GEDLADALFLQGLLSCLGGELCLNVADVLQQDVLLRQHVVQVHAVQAEDGQGGDGNGCRGRCVALPGELCLLDHGERVFTLLNTLELGVVNDLVCLLGILVGGVGSNTNTCNRCALQNLRGVANDGRHDGHFSPPSY